VGLDRLKTELQETGAIDAVGLTALALGELVLDLGIDPAKVRLRPNGHLVMDPEPGEGKG